MKQEIRESLEQLAEPEYAAFSRKLLPGVSNLCGVRLPKLRRMAKRIAKEDAQAYLSAMRTADWSASACYFEEKMLYGLVIGYAKLDDGGYRKQLERFVPLIDNWSVCDSCCLTYEWRRKNPQFWWEELNCWIRTDTEFGVRFGLVSMLAHFVDQTYVQDILNLCGRIRPDGYYAKMAAAWLVSDCFAKFPEETYVFLQQDAMDDFMHNKSIQKICESTRVDREWKALLRGLRAKAAAADLPIKTK